MNVSKEVRIGLLVTIAMVVLFTGFYFLKGSDLLSDERTYYCYYHNVQGLVKSANVELNGLEVGHVTDLALTDDNRIKVTLTVAKNIEMHTGTVASISSSNILSGKIIKMELGAGAGVIAPESTIPTSEAPSLLDDIGGQVTPIMNNLKATMAALDTILKNVNLLVGTENRQAIAATLQSVNLTAANLNRLSTSLATEADDMKGIIRNTNQFTATLAKSDDTVTRILSNLNNVTSQLAHAPMQKAFTDLQGTVTQLQGIMDKVNNNQGSLGMLVNNKDLYTNMNGTLKSLDQLLADMKEHPSRYINVTIFGKKK